MSFSFFFFNDTATTEIYTLSLHDALPISTWTLMALMRRPRLISGAGRSAGRRRSSSSTATRTRSATCRSEEHTSELQSLDYLVCRLLLEKKKKNQHQIRHYTTKAHMHHRV